MPLTRLEKAGFILIGFLFFAAAAILLIAAGGAQKFLIP